MGRACRTVVLAGRLRTAAADVTPRPEFRAALRTRLLAVAAQGLGAQGVGLGGERLDVPVPTSLDAVPAPPPARSGTAPRPGRPG